MNIQHLYYISPSTDPYFNLALENVLLDKMERNFLEKKRIYLFYRNNPCVVMGHFQNPWCELNLKKWSQMNIPLVRRTSGGGCVYHDLGNLNFSVIQTKNVQSASFPLILKSLQTSSFQPYKNERNDLVFCHKNKIYKFSGSAFRNKLKSHLHHGTLLFEANLENLQGLLRPRAHYQLQTKAIPSVRSQVSNIGQWVNENIFLKKITSRMTLLHEKEMDLSRIEELQKQYSSPEWIWHKTPDFVFDSENFIAHIHKGLLKEISFKHISQNMSLYFSQILMGQKIDFENLKSWYIQDSSFPQGLSMKESEQIKELKTTFFQDFF